MPYAPSGTLTTDKRTVSDSETWDTQTEWEAYQSKTDVNITSGSLELTFSEYPSSATHAFDARELSLSDGDSVTVWPDEIGGLNLEPGTAPTYRASGINGNPSVEFNDNILSDTVTLSDPFAAVFCVQFDGTSGMACAGWDTSSTSRFDGHFNTVTLSDSGGDLAGPSADTNPHIYTFWRDPSTSILRVDGSQVDSGDVGSFDVRDYDTILLGNRTSSQNQPMTGDIAHVTILENPTTSDVEAVENDIGGDYGITIS